MTRSVEETLLERTRGETRSIVEVRRQGAHPSKAGDGDRIDRRFCRSADHRIRVTQTDEIVPVADCLHTRGTRRTVAQLDEEE